MLARSQVIEPIRLAGNRLVGIVCVISLASVLPEAGLLELWVKLISDLVHRPTVADFDAVADPELSALASAEKSVKLLLLLVLGMAGVEVDTGSSLAADQDLKGAVEVAVVAFGIDGLGQSL